MTNFKYNQKSFSTQKELFDFLRKNEKSIIETKKNFSFSEAINTKFSILKNTKEKIDATKSKMNLDGEEVSEVKDIDIVNVIIIGNTMNWLDSQDDVLINDSFKKSLLESQGKIKHLKDHDQKSTGKVGIPNKVYLQDFSLTELGIQKTGNTQCLVMDSNVLKCYNENVFYQYMNKDVDQHSVGMIYVKILLCLNDATDVDKFKNWNSYYSNIINPEKADRQGFFFAVTEAKLLEVSNVLFGSNEITPTLGTNIIIEPSEDTQKTEPLIINTQKTDNSQKIKQMFNL